MSTVFISPDAGAVMAKIRQFVMGEADNWLLQDYTQEWVFGTSHGKQAVTLNLTIPEIGVEVIVFTCACLESGDLMPFRAMIQEPGFEGWSTALFAPDNDPPLPMSDLLAFWKQNVCDVKQEMINTWSYGSPRDITYDHVDVIAAKVESHIAIIPVADSDGMSVSRELLYGTLSAPIEEETFIWEDGNSGVPAGVAGTNVDTSRLTAAISELADQYQEISFNHGQSVFSVRGRIITG